jgi:hypothetical protein
VVGEAVRVDPQVDLEGGVGPLKADVVGGHVQRVGPLDPDPDGSWRNRRRPLLRAR